MAIVAEVREFSPAQAPRRRRPQPEPELTCNPPLLPPARRHHHRHRHRRPPRPHQACKRPFYVAAESTKFARMFPLSQARTAPPPHPLRTPSAHAPRPLRTPFSPPPPAAPPYLLRTPPQPSAPPPHPLPTQHDLPKSESKREHAAFVGLGPPPNNLVAEKPSRDYTPPCYITLLFTDLGVLTPSAVSDELIKLFD